MLYLGCNSQLFSASGLYLDLPAVCTRAEATLTLLLDGLIVNNSFQPEGLCCYKTTACKTEIWASVQTIFFPHKLETSLKIKALTLSFGGVCCFCFVVIVVVVVFSCDLLWMRSHKLKICSLH